MTNCVLWPYCIHNIVLSLCIFLIIFVTRATDQVGVFVSNCTQFYRLILRFIFQE